MLTSANLRGQLKKALVLKGTFYVKNYDGQTEWVYFLIEDDEFLKKNNTI